MHIFSFWFQVSYILLAEANPIIPPQFFTNLVERLRPSFFTSRHHGSPHLQGGLNPEFNPAIRNYKRQVAPQYGAPPSAQSAPSYSAPSPPTYGSPAAPVGNSYGSPAAPTASAPVGNASCTKKWYEKSAIEWSFMQQKKRLPRHVIPVYFFH